MIVQVGNYYHCLRQRPDKKKNSFEYVPNKNTRIEMLNELLTQLQISVLPTRMWNEASLSVLNDQIQIPVLLLVINNSNLFSRISVQ
jgi:hypothetical protein